MKHIGKIKNNNAKIVVAYRTLPGDPYSCLVIASSSLGESYHDSLMNLVQDPSGQNANEFADILSVRKFPDGNNMLSWLHTYGHLKKVPTNNVIMTPTPKTSIALNELNDLIAQQKGVSIDELAVKDSSTTKSPNKNTESVINTSDIVEEANTPKSANELRARAESLIKEAQQLKIQADKLDPPQKKSKKVNVVA